MGIKKRYSKELKLSILKELETKRMAEVCRAYEIAPSNVSGWRNDYETNPKDANLAEKDRLIGQLYTENAFFKKVYEKLKHRIAEENRCSAK